MAKTSLKNRTDGPHSLALSEILVASMSNFLAKYHVPPFLSKTSPAAVLDWGIVGVGELGGCCGICANDTCSGAPALNTLWKKKKKKKKTAKDRLFPFAPQLAGAFFHALGTTILPMIGRRLPRRSRTVSAGLR